MRHDDRQGNNLVTDPEHLMVMNAGRGFWHSKRRSQTTRRCGCSRSSSGHTASISSQTSSTNRFPTLIANEWRHLFGPRGPTPAVRSQRCRLLRLPPRRWRHGHASVPTGLGTYLYVFEGAVDIGDESVGYTESALVTDHSDVTVTATGDSTIVAFAINPDAPITRQGTIGR